MAKDRVAHCHPTRRRIHSSVAGAWHANNAQCIYPEVRYNGTIHAPIKSAHSRERSGPPISKGFIGPLYTSLPPTILVFKSLRGETPSYQSLSPYDAVFTRMTPTLSLSRQLIPGSQTVFGGTGPKVHVWNSLPATMRHYQLIKQLSLNSVSSNDF